MKKTKQIDTYYCDYCGKECEHTPELVLPAFDVVKLSNPTRFITGEDFYFERQDICPDCFKKIGVLLRIIDNVKITDTGICIEV